MVSPLLASIASRVPSRSASSTSLRLPATGVNLYLDPMTEPRSPDAIILGGGLVGLTLALALDRSGLTSVVVDPLDPAQLTAPGFDGRASAIASASWRMFEALGLAPALTPLACPIRSIHVAEGTVGRDGLDFDTGADEEPLGRMVPNRELRRVLNEAAAEAEHVTVLSGRTPAAVTRDEHRARVVAGRRHRTRRPAAGGRGRAALAHARAGGAAGRALESYEHAAIVTALTHERPHDNVAFEIFYPDGPFALLPLLDDADGRHRSALVWSVSKPDAEGLLKLGPRGFAAAAQPKSLDALGRIELAAERSTYPLGFHHAATIVADRLALVGDAAHGIHPIAGQGLNLGLRDAAALAEVLVDGARLGMDAGDHQGLARYNRWRALDTLSVAGATDGLTRLFGLRGRSGGQGARDRPGGGAAGGAAERLLHGGGARRGRRSAPIATGDGGMIVGVIGAGQMGAGIAQVAAAAGHRVLLSDVGHAEATAGRAKIGSGLDRLVAKEKLTADDAAATLDRIEPVHALSDMAPADLVVEAATEREAVKRAIFAEVGACCRTPRSWRPTRRPSRSRGWPRRRPTRAASWASTSSTPCRSWG